MRRPPYFSQLSSLLQQLRDPRIQVWLMAASALLLLGIGHVRAWSGAGEGKNQAHGPASRLLVAGARLDWTESFGPAQRESRRPSLTLHSPVPQAGRASAPPTRPAASLLGVRSAMQEASSKPWKHLERPLRRQLAAAPKGPQPWQVQLHWSGDDRGNAALVAGRWNSASTAAGSAHFVIGNGSRCGDGEIKALSSGISFAKGRIDITLIGRGGAPTGPQLAALGELLHHLEALSGQQLMPNPSAATLSSPPL